ncbi:nuclear transport factor 2 family protein [Arcicella sp. BE140]|uniref:nuclear transport factor 2 family protein n=2 Tax=Arcicella TaxID=217140 RepID=UPI00286C2FB5|nr:nuclear transport factor 2 family protein [Arcicella sp. BE140]
MKITKNMRISKLLLHSFCLLLCLSFSVKAQSEDDAIKTCVNNYLDGVLKGDAARLNLAFHPTAMLRTVNTNTGALQDIPVAKFIATTPAGGIETKGGSTKLVGYSYIGVSALATVELRFGDFKYVDLLSMLKFGNDWKIVSRVFSRTDLDSQVKGTATSASPVAATNKPAVKKSSSANVKPKADDGW